MRRDPMRVFAWILVGIGLFIWAFVLATLPVRISNYAESMEMWRTVVSLNRMTARMGGVVAYEPPPPSPGQVTVWGLSIGALPLGFGVLLLAIRRPAPRSETAPKPAPLDRIRAKINKVVSRPAEDLIPKAKAQVRPPWEKDPNA